jgi:hypothetical protein
MNPMRSVRRAVLLLALFWLVPRVAVADPITGNTVILQSQQENASGAGPFTATVNGDPSTAFVTLCLQADVGTWADLGTPLAIEGVTDSASYQNSNQGGEDNGRDPLSSQTAWLFTQFRNGTLEGYDQSPAAAAAVQYAIWELEGERAIPAGAEYSGLANSFVALANEAVANGFTGIGDVRVLNLVNADGTDAQDQLVMVQDEVTLVPEPSSAGLLAVGAFLVLVGRGRFAGSTTA